MAVSLESLKKTIGKKKSNSMAFAWLADLERESGDLDLALQRVDGGLTLYPNDVAARLVRAKILFQKELYEDCITECGKVLECDPLCLSAQKWMGDAYDKLENVNERNKCYRCVHYMDPLDTFWKDEYDNVVENTSSDEAQTVVSEGDFVMPGLAEASQETSDDQLDFGNIDFNDSSSDEAPLFDKSVENAALDSDDDFTLESIAPTPAEPEDNFVSPFSSSFAEQLETPEEPASPVEEMVEETEENDEDPFAAFAAFDTSGDANDEAEMSDLQASLDSVMASLENGDDNQDEFPAEEDISGNDVASALAGVFGVDDDLEPEEGPEDEASPFANLDIPTSIEDEDKPVVEDKPKVEDFDKPVSVDTAFSSIFGDDEFPEEKTQSSGLFEKSAESFELEPEAEASAPKPSVAEDKPLSVDSAFDSIFGEDEVPEEKPKAEEADKPLSVDTAFNSIFGEDEFPEEKLDAPAAQEQPVVQEVAASLVDQVTQAEDELTLPPTVEETSMTSEVDGAFSSMFGNEDELPTNTPVIEKSIPNAFENDLGKSFDNLFGESEEPLNDKHASSAPSASLDSLETEVDGAFKGLFSLEDDTPEEKDAPTSNKGVDFLMSGDSDDEVSDGLLKDPTAPLDRGSPDIDERLNTRTLAEIYFEQGLYTKALEIYQDLASKEPGNQEILNRLAQVERLCREKFGG